MDRARVPQHEVWPADEPYAHYVGAAPVSASRIPTASQETTSARRFQRVASVHTVTPPLRPSRRSITSIEDPHKSLVQGFCRMSWFAGLRCTRFLRLAGSTLECFDSAIRKRLWLVVLEGARVRIVMPKRKIVLSKLPVGVVEFYVADEKTCRQWAASLLRASAIAPSDRRDF